MGVAIYTLEESTHLTMPVLSLGICTYVIVVDAHSKWSEVIMTKFTTYMKTVEILKTIFVRSGLPEQLVSDNRPKFVSEEIKEFGSKRNSSYN